MVDQLKEIPKKKILEWWNKFEPKQKTLIISAAAGVLVAFAVLVWLLSRPQYVLLSVSETTKETADITTLLDGADPAIEYRVSTDGYRVEVLKEQLSQANLLLGANNIPAAAYDLSNVTSGGIVVVVTSSFGR